MALRVDVNDEAIAVTLDVVDGEPGELATFESAGELQRDDGGVATSTSCSPSATMTARAPVSVSGRFPWRSMSTSGFCRINVSVSSTYSLSEGLSRLSKA